MFDGFACDDARQHERRAVSAPPAPLLFCCHLHRLSDLAGRPRCSRAALEPRPGREDEHARPVARSGVFTARSPRLTGRLRHFVFCVGCLDRTEGGVQPKLRPRGRSAPRSGARPSTRGGAVGMCSTDLVGPTKLRRPSKSRVPCAASWRWRCDEGGCQRQRELDRRRGQVGMVTSARASTWRAQRNLKWLKWS